MPTDDLEREMRDLFARILEAGRRSGEAAATDRLVKAVRAAAGHNPPLCQPHSDPGAGAERTCGLDPTPTGSDREPSHISSTSGKAPTGIDRLPPYWRPR